MDFFERPWIGSPKPIAGSRDEIFPNREVWKYLTPLGDEANAQLGNPERGKAATSCPAKRIAPDRAGVSPMMERMVVVFPMPLRPIRATISPVETRSDMPNSTWLRP